MLQYDETFNEDKNVYNKTKVIFVCHLKIFKFLNFVMVLVVGMCFLQDVNFGKYGVFYATSFVVFVIEGIVISPINVNIDANGIPA